MHPREGCARYTSVASYRPPARRRTKQPSNRRNCISSNSSSTLPPIARVVRSGGVRRNTVGGPLWDSPERLACLRVVVVVPSGRFVHHAPEAAGRRFHSCRHHCSCDCAYSIRTAPNQSTSGLSRRAKGQREKTTCRLCCVGTLLYPQNVRIVSINYSYEKCPCRSGQSGYAYRRRSYAHTPLQAAISTFVGLLLLHLILRTSAPS